MKNKTPGRQQLTCANNTCKGATKDVSHATFSTHSSNRTVCHACKPKCYEQHFFGNHILAPKKKKGPVEQTVLK